jgi:predicted anti-sigma-YlaC factor YlaD
MTCAELEILLADYLDGTLRGEEESALVSHLAGCLSCAELAREAAGAVAFMERAASVEAPPELVTRIVAAGKTPRSRRLFGRWLGPVLQPRFALGMAMTVLSFTMLGLQLKPSDLDPVKVWRSAEDRADRAWERGVKYYESRRLVFEIQARLQEWGEEDGTETR